MKTYVVYVGWYEPRKRGNGVITSKRLEVKAEDICSASAKALEGFSNRIGASVSCIWPKL